MKTMARPTTHSKIQTGFRGFTLIELLVVISIIAVLAAILFPVFAKAKASAKSTVCISNLRQIGAAMTMYMADCDDHFPSCADSSDLNTNSWALTPYAAQVATFPELQNVLANYVKAPDIFKCPADQGTHVIEFSAIYNFETTPNLFAKYGSSYLWHTDISVKGLTGTDLSDPSGVLAVVDASGSWHTREQLADTASWPNVRDHYRYNVLFTDMHAKSRSTTDAKAAFKIQ